MGKGFTVSEVDGFPPVIHWDPSPVLDQLSAAGLLPHILPASNYPRQFKGVGLLPEMIDCLRRHPSMLEGEWHWLHPSVGFPRTEFRSITGSLGPGSLQVVINTETGAFEADVDLHNTQDVVNIVAHLGGEVLGSKLKRAGSAIAGWFRRKRVEG